MLRCLLALSFDFSLLAAPFAGGSSGDPSRSDYVDGRVLVGFKSGTTATQRTDALHAVGATQSDNAGFGVDVASVPSGKVLEKVAALRARGHVAVSVPDYVLP